MSLALCLVCCATVRARAEDAQSQFRAGITAFQKNDFKTAEKTFIEILQVEPDNTVVLHNLALTAAKEGQLGYAVALWRKALSLQPGYPPSEIAISWARKKLEHPEIPHEVEYWESFRNALLTDVSLSTFLLLSAFFSLAGGWLLLKYFGARRRTVLDEKSLPAFPFIATTISVLFILFALLSAAKFWDMATPRGTVIEKKIEARSAPDAASTALFDLYEGLEVIVDQSHSGWLQVTYPGGPTGWVPGSALFTTEQKVHL